MKVFGLGLSKTGTSSLTDALILLGFRAVHYPLDLAMAKDVDALTDIPVAPYYAELDRLWPGSRFILTIREKTSWLRSIEMHWRLMLQWWDDATPGMRRYHERVAMAAYGTLAFDREHFSRTCDAHERKVRDYFRGRPHDLLVIDICGGEGWPHLCPFLGLAEPRAPFPHANEWMHMLLQASAEIAEQVPAGEGLILVDEQGFGSEFAGSRRAIPFLERDGQYWGAPPDDGTAIRELERLRAGGASFLAFGWPAFWWLDHYTELRSYVDARFRCTLRNERLVVYDLREGLR
ncbi:MAG TPA: sulfotransferase [Thermoanaerobaculia bacterium]|nr:sulfotransferase [Thermoanaerobaculia bacterium]